MLSFDKMTPEDYDSFLVDVVADLNAEEILSVPGVREALAAHYRDQVQDTWAKAYPDLAQLWKVTLDGETILFSGTQHEADHFFENFTDENPKAENVALVNHLDQIVFVYPEDE